MCLAQPPFNPTLLFPLKTLAISYTDAGPMPFSIARRCPAPRSASPLLLLNPSAVFNAREPVFT